MQGSPLLSPYILRLLVSLYLSSLILKLGYLSGKTIEQYESLRVNNRK
jgi:hypothetical protein